MPAITRQHSNHYQTSGNFEPVLFIVVLRLSIKKSLFSVQRVVKIVAAAKSFFFFVSVL